MNQHRKTMIWPIALLLLAVTLIAYWPIRLNDYVGYDDVEYVLENGHVSAGLTLAGIRWALTTTSDANWFPLTWISHMIDVSVFGLEPGGHLMVNLGLHCVNALLLLCLLTRLTSSVWRSALVAALFALHPLHVESVAWLAERKDLLATLFYLLAMSAYVRYAAAPGVGRYALLLFLFICGLLSKPMAVTMPLALLLLDYWPLDRLPEESSPWKRLQRLLLEKAPLLALSLASCLVTLWVQKTGGTLSPQGGAYLLDNTIHAVFSYLLYLQKCFVPTGLAVIYPYNPNLPVLLVLTAVSTMAVISLFAFKLRQTRPYLLFGWLWFLVTLLPVSGIIRFGVHSMADRYSYIPLIGIFVMVAWGIGDLLHGRSYAAPAAVVLALVTLPVLCLATSRQVSYWRNGETLFNHALAVTDNNWVAHFSLATELTRLGRPDEALRHFQDAARIKPNYIDTFINMGIVQAELGDNRAALAAYEWALRLDPKSTDALLGIGMILAEQGNVSAATRVLDALVPLDADKAGRLSEYIQESDASGH